MAHRATFRRSRRKNLFGFGKRTTYSPTLIKQAHEAGRRSGDTKQFGNWWAKQKHEHPPSGSLKRRAEKQYRAGVESLWTERAKETKAESKEVIQDVTDALVGQGMKKAQAVAKAKAAFKSGQGFEETFRKAMRGTGKTSKMSANPRITMTRELAWAGATDAANRNMRKAKRTKWSRADYNIAVRTFKKLWPKENPPKFDRCVAAVKKSLKGKKRPRPGNAYAICTAAGTRNPTQEETRYWEQQPIIARFGVGNAIKAVTLGEKLSAAGIRHVVQLSEGGAGFASSYIVRAPWPYQHAARKLAAQVRKRNPKASARVRRASRNKPPYARAARKKATSHARKQRKAPTQKANPRTVWSARQGKLKAVITKPLIGSYKVRIMGGPRVLEEFSPKKFDEAVAIARLRLADTRMQGGNPKPAPRMHRGVSRTFRASKRKNPMDLALKRYEEFHGMPSEEILQFEEKEHHHSAKVGLGQLVSILVTLINGKTVPLNSPGFTEKGFNGRKYWEFDEKTPTIKRVYLTSSEDGKQLFIDGGDQSIPTEALRALGITQADEHDHMLIGTIRMITYRTRKSFEGKGKEEVDFHHRFGGQQSKGVAPVLLYFKRSEKLRIAGGRYTIAAPERDLGNVSPGIVG